MGAQIGDEVLTAAPGTRRVQAARHLARVLERGHAPARVLEIISPAGFEAY